MKDSCGICSTFLHEGEEVMKMGSPTKRKSFGDRDFDDMLEVESIVHSPSKLDSIVEAKESSEVDSEEKKDDEKRDGPKSDAASVEPHDEPKVEIPASFAVATTSPKAVAVAVQRNPMKEITVFKNESSTLERDFDKNPTDLYLSLMRKDWSAAIRRCGERPDEAKTWIYRREKGGNLRWKLLPIHASIIFNAPVPVVDALLHAHAEGAACKDDQGMVPLHLAIRMNSDQVVVQKLVAAQPTTVAATDRKGRTPRALAEKQSSTPKTLLVIQTLDNAGTTVKSTASPSFNSAQAIAKAAAVAASRSSPNKTSSDNKSKAIADASPNSAKSSTTTPTSPKTGKESAAVAATNQEIEYLKQLHGLEIEKIHREATTKESQLTARIEALEKAIAIDKDSISGLEEHVRTLQEQESELQSKVTEMEVTVADTIKEKNLSEDNNKAVISNLVSQIGDLQNKLTAVTAERDAVTASTIGYEESSRNEMAKLKLKGFELERQLGQITYLKKQTDDSFARAEYQLVQQKNQIAALQEDSTTLRQTVRTMEAKLEEVTISEQELAWQNAALTLQLAGGTKADNGEHALEKDRVVLVEDDKAGDREMADRIEALERERDHLHETVNKLSVKLYKVVGFLDEMVQEQEAIIAETTTETRQGGGEQQVEGNAGNCLPDEEAASDDRQKLLSNVTTMKEQIIGVIDSVIEGMPSTFMEQDNDSVVDESSATSVQAGTLVVTAAVLQ